jgi:chitin synthase
VKDNKSFQALDKTFGLDCVPPEHKLKPSILRSIVEAPKELRLELLIVVAMYNEGPDHFRNTIGGILQNLRAFKKKGIDPRRIACVIIVDGIKPMMQTFEENRGFFKNFFDPEAIKQRFNVEDIINDIKLKGEDEIAHLFMQNVSEPEDTTNYLQLIFCVKQLNKRKLNTHLWFFGGFCYMLKPRFIQLIDVGTRPMPRSIWYLYEAMVVDRHIAGVCGEIAPMDPSWFNFVEPAQRVEYKFSHVFDKALESIFGFITVLPGAFSAYRWSAVKGEPLWLDYFMSFRHPENMDAYHSNIYLAEDRVLSLALVSRKKRKYILRYVKKSLALTDVPNTISILMAQRRRWINGSWFAMIDVIRQFKKIYKSGHHPIRKCCFTLQLVYFTVNVVFSWFMVGSFFLALAVLLRKKFPTQAEDQELFAFGNAIVLIYMTLLIIVFIMSLAVKPKHVNDVYKVIAAVFGIYILASFYFMFDFIINPEDGQDWILFIVLGTIIVFVIGSLLHGGLWDVIYGCFHFIYLTPTYVNVFFIYAVCNTHDCSWGNRPDQLTAEEKLALEEFEAYRTRWVIIWVLCNSVFAYFISIMDQKSADGFWYVSGLALVSTGILVIRMFGCIFYLFHEVCCHRKYNPDKDADHISDVASEDSNLTINSSRRSRRNNRDVPADSSDADSQNPDPPALQRRNTGASGIFSRSGDMINEGNLQSPSDMSLSEGPKSARHFVQDETLGSQIRQAREKRQWTVEELARYSGLEARAVMGIEEGIVYPSHTEYRKLKDALENPNIGSR